jgi:eukaryotic-like serine/threonine-protein kinase
MGGRRLCATIPPMKEEETETAIRLPGWSGTGPVLERGDVLGRYFILDRLGSGGMGIVYAAYDPELDRKVAIKLLRPGRAGAEAGARLLREAQAMARLSHPNVLAVHDVGTFGDQVFVAMELVDGADLRQWLAASPRSEREVLDVFLKAGRGLAAAHAAGLVHLDFKPANVLVGRDGRVRVADFGLAQAEGGEESGGAGTRGYMAPEQLTSQPVDARTDQFSFCVSLYEALYGARPFAPDSFEVEDSPPGSRVPIRLRRLLLRGLAPDPAGRFASMDDLLAALENDPRPVRRRWAMTLALTAVVGSALLGLGWIWRERAQVCRERRRGWWESGMERPGNGSAKPSWPRALPLPRMLFSEWSGLSTPIRAPGPRCTEKPVRRPGCEESSRKRCWTSAWVASGAAWRKSEV